MESRARVAVLTGGPRDGETVQLRNDSPVLCATVPGKPDQLAIYLRHREGWLFSRLVPTSEFMGPTPSSVRELVAYLVVRPRVRLMITGLLPREVKFTSYDRHRLYWDDGSFTILVPPVRTDSEAGIEFDAVGVTVHLRYLSTRIEYLP